MNHEGNLVATGLRFAIVASRFNSLVVDQLIAGARDGLSRHGAAEGDVDLYRCSGTFELPPLLKRVAASGRYHAVIAIGCVIRGGTPHFEYVAGEVARGVGQVSMAAECAVSFGVLTCDNLEQALERAGAKAGNKGYEAAAAAIEQANVFRALAGPARGAAAKKK
jgi:6,7-dimethyl-8-ribityllumazine synthase